MRGVNLCTSDFSTCQMKDLARADPRACAYCREASNVEVKDPEWDEKLFRSEGDSSASFEVIPAGATKSFSYSVTPKIKLQRFEQPQTEIKYNDGDKEIKSHGPTLYLQTFSGEDWLKYKAIKLGSTLTFGMMKTETQWIRASVMTVGSCFVYVTIQLVRGFKEASATRRRRRALAELEKDE